MKNLSLILGLLLFCGCATPTTSAGTGYDSANCLLRPGDASTTFVDFQGTKVGLCCDMCVAGFNAMSDEEKAAKIAAAGK